MDNYSPIPGSCGVVTAIAIVPFADEGQARNKAIMDYNSLFIPRSAALAISPVYDGACRPELLHACIEAIMIRVELFAFMRAGDYSP